MSAEAEAGKETTWQEAYQVAVSVLKDDAWVLDHSGACKCGSCKVCTLAWFREKLELFKNQGETMESPKP